MQSVYVVDVLLPLVDLTLHPVTVEVAEEVVDVFRGGRVTAPFADVKRQQRFFRVTLRILVYLLQMIREVLSKELVEFLAQKVSCV